MNGIFQVNFSKQTKKKHISENDLNEQHIECLAKCLTKQTCIKELNLASIDNENEKIKIIVFHQ